MRSLVVFLICICAVALIGCGKSDTSSTTSGSGTEGGTVAANSVVGTWKLEPSEEAKKEEKVPTATCEFKDDNTFSITITMGERSDTMTGKYTLAGKTLTMTPEMEDGKPSSDKPETVTLSDDMKSFPAPGAPQLGNMVKQ